MRILITGANGHLGRRVIRRLNADNADAEIYALVRSERARGQIEEEGLNAVITIVDYGDAAALARVGGHAGKFDAVIHLVGIIKESSSNPFEKAHEGACRALIESGIEAERIVSLGIVGTAPNSQNACLLSRHKADQLLLEASIPATILRVPMVLGPDDYASASLARNARKALVLSWRASSLEQPIDSRDVIDAILTLISLPAENRIVELAGPESLSRRTLIQRTAALTGHRPTVVSLPMLLGYSLAWVFEKLSGNPPVTCAMLGVLDHDDQVDITTAVELLELQPRPLDETLEMVLASQSSAD